MNEIQKHFKRCTTGIRSGGSVIPLIMLKARAVLPPLTGNSPAVRIKKGKRISDKVIRHRRIFA